MKIRAYCNWSSGKDSALALYKARMVGEYEVSALCTAVDAEQRGIPLHGVGVEALRQQAELLGLPITLLPGPAKEAVSHSELENAMQAWRKEGVRAAIFGDIYLQDVRAYRIERLAGTGMEPVFPLWGMSCREVLRQFIDSGFRAVVTGVNAAVLDKRFVGRILDQSFLADLPQGVDPCGENGEYHTFVFDGPLFRAPVQFFMGAPYYLEYQDENGNAAGASWISPLCLK
jgi:uncharacterized protein (TIGR00290 family)